MGEMFFKYWFNWLLGGVSAVLGAGWAWVLKKYKVLHAQQIANNAGTLALLKDRLFSTCQKHINAGYCTATDRENLESLYNAYTTMGGNGTGTDLYNAVRALPFTKGGKQ